MKPVVVPCALGHDVDHAQHRLAAVHDRAGAERDLDVIDQLERHPRPALEVSGAVPRLVGGHAVDQEQHVVTVVAGYQHAARTDLDGVLERRGHHAERRVVDGFAQRSQAVDP